MINLAKATFWFYCELSLVVISTTSHRKHYYFTRWRSCESSKKLLLENKMNETPPINLTMTGTKTDNAPIRSHDFI